MKCKVCLALGVKKIKEAIIFNHVGIGFCSEEHRALDYAGIKKPKRYSRGRRGR